MRSPSTFTALGTAAALVLALGTPSALGQTNYVSPNGSLGPWKDSNTQPFGSIETAARALPSSDPSGQMGGGTVRCLAGAYPGPITLRSSSPTRRITFGSGGGIAKLGDPQGQPPGLQTSFNVLAYNTRLFDATILTAITSLWEDQQRAIEIGKYLNGVRSKYDVVGLCEVWHNCDFCVLPPIFIPPGGPLIPLPPITTVFEHFDSIKEESNYPVSAYFKLAPIFNKPINSGLGLLSRHGFQGPAQLVGFGGNCVGEDCLSDKGFVFADFVLLGFFQIRVYNSHTNAVPSVFTGGDSAAARRAQLTQIRDSITAYRNATPNGTVILMGDLNVIGEEFTGGQWVQTTEYQVFRQLFEPLGGKDAARHAPDGALVRDPRSHATFKASENIVAAELVGPGNERLDYIIYFPCKSGAVKIKLNKCEVVKPQGPNIPVNGINNTNLSDHYGVGAEFTLSL